MLNSKVFFAVIIAMVASISAAWGQSIRAKVTPERDSLIIGDPMALLINIQAPKGITIRVPSVEALLESEASKNPDGDFLELVEASDLSSRETTDFNVFEQTVTITAWNQGVYTFPALAFIAESNGQKDSFFSEPVTINVKFPTPVTGDSTFIADIKPVLQEPTYWSDYLWLLWIFLGLLLLTVAGFLIGRYIQTRRNPVALPITPEEKALKQLEQLLMLRVAQSDAPEYHAQVSYILRAYLNARYGLLALENTTTELLEQLSNVPELRTFEKRIEEVLQTADLVKFAKASPLESAHIFAAETTADVVNYYQPPAAKAVGNSIS